MAFGQTVNIKGLKELSAVLKKLPERMRQNVWKAAIRAGSNVIKKSVRANAPVGRGHISTSGSRRRGKGLKKFHLRDSLKVVDNNSRSNRFYVKFRVISDDPKAHLVERGTKAHEVKAKLIRRVLRGNLQTGIRIMVLPNGRMTSAYHHPGAKANPFMSRGFERAANAAILAVAKKAEQRIQKLSMK